MNDCYARIIYVHNYDSEQTACLPIKITACLLTDSIIYVKFIKWVNNIIE